MPGSPLDPRAEGGNHLIREGATLITDASQVVEALAPLHDAALRLGFGAGGTPKWQAERSTGIATLWDEFELPGVGRAPEAELVEDTRLLGRPSEPDGDLRTRLLELLGPTPVTIDDLVHSSGAAAREVHRQLLELELEGAIERQPGGMLARLPR